MKSIKSNDYTVVTGASSGIGLETAKAFAVRGSNLILAARRVDRLQRLTKDIVSASPQLDVVVCGVDLSCTSAVYEFYEKTREYPIATWINNAGFGDYSSVADQDLEKIERMLRVDIGALTILSTLFVRDYKNTPGTQLINVSSAGGYMLVPNAITYCAAKFYVSAFTEGLDRELQLAGAKMRAKVFAPAATQTEFGKVASGMDSYDYDEHFASYYSTAQAAKCLMDLYDSEETVGVVNRQTFAFCTCEPRFPYARANG